MRHCLGAAAFSFGLVLSACAEPPAGIDSEGSGTETESETESETGGGEVDDHGTIRIQVAPIGGDASIFASTATVIATVNYQSCLQNFYLLDHPELAQDGSDGMPLFQSWFDKLCTDFEGTPPCMVENISQNLIMANSVYSLAVEVSIADPTSLANSEIHVGPIPTTAFAGCPAAVEVQASGLIGRNQSGDQLWTISTLPANNVATTNQGAAVLVEVDSVF